MQRLYDDLTDSPHPSGTTAQAHMCEVIWEWKLHEATQLGTLQMFLK